MKRPPDVEDIQGQVSIPENIPTVALYNNLETFFGFLRRSDDPDIFRKRMYRGDRGLFWLGDPKLLFATAATPDAAQVCKRWGYPGTKLLAPAHPTHQLSLDILRENELLTSIVEYAGSAKSLCMVPYATTSEFYKLTETLRNTYGITVCLPESPSPTMLWLRDYADSKAGFRALASECLPTAELLPRGFICKNTKQAGGAVEWFLEHHQPCVVKADGGESGIGHIIFRPGDLKNQSVQDFLEKDTFLKDDIIIVEEFISSSEDISPSLEFYVPPITEGAPQITYVSKQCFSSFGRFAGVVLCRNLEKTCWYAPLADSGTKMASHLQKLGYVGHFDLDAVLDDNGHLYLLETNARRTGGTYVHEFATYTFGPDYLRRVALMSINALNSRGITRLEILLDWLSELLFPINSSERGIVVTVTSTLAAGEFGCILVAEDEPALSKLQLSLSDRLQAYPER